MPAVVALALVSYRAGLESFTFCVAETMKFSPPDAALDMGRSAAKCKIRLPRDFSADFVCAGFAVSCGQALSKMLVLPVSSSCGRAW